MQSDALNKQILHDQFEKSEPHSIDLINYLKNSIYVIILAPINYELNNEKKSMEINE